MAPYFSCDFKLLCCNRLRGDSAAILQFEVIGIAILRSGQLRFSRFKSLRSELHSLRSDFAAKPTANLNLVNKAKRNPFEPKMGVANSIRAIQIEHSLAVESRETLPTDPEGPTIEQKTISSDRVKFSIHTWIENFNPALKVLTSNEIINLD